MKKNTVTARDDLQRVGFGRRYFLSLPLVVGGMVILNESVATGSVELSAAFIQENVSVSDSIILYTSLLPDLRKSVFYGELEEIGLIKELASVRFQSLFESAHSLGSKYQNAQTVSRPELLADFRMLVKQVEDTYGLGNILIRAKNELPRLAAIESKIDFVHSHLLMASEYFAKAKNDLRIETRDKLIADGKAKLDEAIEVLRGFLKGDVNESQLNSSVERLIVLLLGVRFAVDKEKPNKSKNNTDVTQKANRSHHAAIAPASSIMQVLRKHVTPGSWLQLAIGYGVAFPVLLRNSNLDVRKKLLMDGLRLVPGLVPSLEDAARDLAALSL